MSKISPCSAYAIPECICTHAPCAPLVPHGNFFSQTLMAQNIDKLLTSFGSVRDSNPNFLCVMSQCVMSEFSKPFCVWFKHRPMYEYTLATSFLIAQGICLTAHHLLSANTTTVWLHERLDQSKLIISAACSECCDYCEWTIMNETLWILRSTKQKQ